MEEGKLSAIRGLQFVDNRNRARYLFRVKENGSKTSDASFIDLKQTHTGHMLTFQGRIIRVALKKKDLQA